MENIPTIENILDLLSEYCRMTYTEENDKYVFNSGRNDKILYLCKSDINQIILDLQILKVDGETALYSDNSYEIMVREESSIPIRQLRDDNIEIKNEDASLKYELSLASNTYLFWLLNEIRQKFSARDFRMVYFNSGISRRNDEAEELSPFDYIRSMSSRFRTLKIQSQKKTTLTQFSKLTHSFLFYFGYNLDIALVPQRLIEEIARRGRINRMRRSNLSELDFPKREYKEDLAQHYLLAVSTDNPVIEYLSYYHILEHFFESVFNEDIIKAVQLSITSPDFSYKRKNDIDKLIKLINKRSQIKKETIIFSEEEALRLCIEKFIDLTKLIDELNVYDNTLIDFYKNNKVGFSNGIEVNIRNNDVKKVYTMLAKRIYATRNSLVHSKDGEKSKYTPFKDDRTLVKEVPLMRFISEMVIIHDSTLMQ